MCRKMCCMTHHQENKPRNKLRLQHSTTILNYAKSIMFPQTWNLLNPDTSPFRNKIGLLRERAVRRIKEGTSAVLLQSGLDEQWWTDSMECYCYLRHVQDLLSDGKTTSERRFGKPSKGPIIPFGSMVVYHPISAKDPSRLHQFGTNVLPGIFLGYALYAGGIWKGDIMVTDIEELEKMDTSEIHAGRLNAKEVLTPRKGDHFIFPVADGTVKLSRGYQVLRTSTLIRDNPDRGEEQGNLPGESEGSSPTPFQNSSQDGEARNDIWSISGNYIYFPSSRWTESQTSLAERRIIPNSTNQGNKYDFGRDARASPRRLLEWRRPRPVRFVDRVHTIQHGPGRDWRRNKRHQGLTTCGQRYGKRCQKQRNEKKNKRGQSRKRSLTRPEDCPVLTSLIQRVRSLKKRFFFKKTAEKVGSSI